MRVSPSPSLPLCICSVRGPRRGITLGAALLALACSTAPLDAAEWRQFRGDDSTSIATAEAWPTSLSEAENLAWRVDLAARGVSSPIVVGQRAVVTSASGYRQDRLHVQAFDTATGRLAWHRQFWATGRTLCHPTSSVAANTPASDGKRLFAFFSSNDLLCLDLDGNLLWMRGLTYDYPTAANDVGMAASPVVLADTVVVQVESQGESFAAGIDAASGATRWRIDRRKGANWTSPVVMRQPGGDDLVLLQSPDRLTAHDPRTGQERWRVERSCSSIPSATALEGVVYLPADGLAALRVPQGGGTPESLWQENRLSADNASPVIYRGQTLTINGAGVLNCGDAATGALQWQLRLKGTYWATPVAAGEHLYAVNQDGLAQVVKLGADRGEIVAEHEFGEPILGSPAAADGALYFRGDAHLWKIARP